IAKKLLGDIKDRFPTDVELLQAHPSLHAYRIVAMDPGLANTVTAVMLDSRFPNRVKNVAISSASQNQPQKNHRRTLNAAKRKRGIQRLENTIQGVEYEQFPSAGDVSLN
ncbi:hypothetical protein BGW39_004893, partial [Mortierella sp. 14UC]